MPTIRRSFIPAARGRSVNAVHAKRLPAAGTTVAEVMTRDPPIARAVLDRILCLQRKLLERPEIAEIYRNFERKARR